MNPSNFNEEHQSALDDLLEREPFQKSILGFLLEECAERTLAKTKTTAADLAESLSKRSIARSGEIYRKTNASTIRAEINRLKKSLDQHYAIEERPGLYRFDIEAYSYCVKVTRRFGFPTPEPGFGERSVVSPPKFAAFLREMAKSELLTDAELTKAADLWRTAEGLPKLDEKGPFEDLLKRFDQWPDNVPFSLASMRKLTRRLGVHPLILDPLIAKPHKSPCLQLDLTEFIAEDTQDPAYGRKAKYAVQSERYEGTDAKFVYLQLMPGGESDVHHHPGDELMVPIQGAIDVRLYDSGINIHLNRGQIVHFHSEQTHSAVNLSDSDPAFVFIIRFYQTSHRRAGVPPTRHIMSRQLRELFQEMRRGQAIGLPSPTQAWVLQSLAGRPMREREDPFREIRDQVGLARMLRFLEAPEVTAEKDFLESMRPRNQIPYQNLTEFLEDLETSDLNLPRGFLDDVGKLYGNIYDLLLLRFLFPAVPGMIVFRPRKANDPESVFKDGVSNDDLKFEVPDGISYSMPTRNLAGSDIAMSELTLGPGARTDWNKHPGYELILPLDGDVGLRFDDNDGPSFEEISANEPTIAHFPSSRLHQVYNRGDITARVLVIRFYGEGTA